MSTMPRALTQHETEAGSLAASLRTQRQRAAALYREGALNTRECRGCRRRFPAATLSEQLCGGWWCPGTRGRQNPLPLPFSGASRSHHRKGGQ